MRKDKKNTNFQKIHSREEKNSPNIIRNGKENNATLAMEIKTKERIYTNSAYKLINFN